MCGIVGFLDKTGNRDATVGHVLFDMLSALDRRGPDSSGVAIYSDQTDQSSGGDGTETPRYVVRVKLGEHGPFEAAAQTALNRLTGVATVLDSRIQGPSLRAVIESAASPTEMEHAVEAAGVSDSENNGAALEVVSVGHRLDLVKQVGSPANLEQTYAVSSTRGTHGIGHTRMSTESRVDLSHSQPFWAHRGADVAVVHNGHITNYHKLRRLYEQRGHRFYTENDSEIIGLYLAERMAQGAGFADALHDSLSEFDGAFSFLVATADALGYVKDPFGFKPLTVTETATFVALATEEQALRAALGDDFPVWEPGVKDVATWQIGRG